MFLKRIYKIIFIFGALFLLKTGTLLALEADDGFGSSHKIEGEHFVVYYAPELDASVLSQHLNVSLTDKFLTGRADKEDYRGTELSDMLDTLFRRVCDILDMQLYSFQGKIKICRDEAHLNRIYNNLFDKNVRNIRSFYASSLNTIYISAESFKISIIGHEMAHAIMSHYFVVQPSVKIQEILAGYVEYQLRKNTNEQD